MTAIVTPYNNPKSPYLDRLGQFWAEDEDAASRNIWLKIVNTNEDAELMHETAKNLNVLHMAFVRRNKQ